MWKPEQYIHIQTIYASRAQRGHNVAGLLKALVAPNGLLHHRIKVLHPDRGTRHPDRLQGIDSRGVDFCRINFDRNLDVLGPRTEGRKRCT
jgi:hypothetical protein